MSADRLQAMVLAAGFGRRMVPLTLLAAKPALPFLNRPLLLRQLDWLAAGGVDAAVVNLHHLPASLEALLEDPPLPVTLSHEPEGALGTSGGLARAAARFADAATIVCVNADMISGVNLQSAVAAHRASGCMASLVLAPPRPGYTVVRHAAGRLREFGGTPAADEATGVFTGIHLLEPELLQRLPEGASEFRPEVYEPMLAAGEAIAVQAGAGPWEEVGTPDRYLDAQIQALTAPPFPGHRDWPGCGGAEDAAVTGGGAASGCILGRNVSIGPDCDITDSILMDGVQVGRGARLTRVIAGPGTRIPAEAVMASVLLQGGAGVLALEPGSWAPARRQGDLLRVDF